MILALALLGTSGAYASTNTHREISTALTHAKLAQKMSSVQQVDLHLHHVINCLEGTKGAEFDAMAGDPCLGMGHGAINDYRGNKLNKEMLQSALEDAQYGLMTKRTQIARNAASLAVKNLKQANDKNL